MGGSEPLSLVGVELVVPAHDHLGSERAEQVREVVRERVVVVDQEDHEAASCSDSARSIAVSSALSLARHSSCSAAGSESATTPTLGVCLGHQALVEACGGEVGYARELVHGKASPVRHVGSGLFTGLPDPFEAGRYHSLAATRLPDVLEPTAFADDGEVMAVRHRELPAAGVQFHPESVLTPDGPALARNFLEGRR